MKNKKRSLKLFIFFLILISLIPFAAAWDGIPPTNLLIYGAAQVNKTDVVAGDIITAHEIDDNNQQVGQSTVNVTGWYPAISLPWDDPDTVTDEGLTYNYPVKIGFKINGRWVEYVVSFHAQTSYGWSNPRGYVKVNSESLEGIPFQVNLSSFPNLAPVISVNNQTVNQGNLLTFSVNATDNTLYRTDTLNFNNPSPTSLNQHTFNSTATATVTWTPSCQQACSSPFSLTYRVTDDGRPSLSDSKNITITVNNVNDAPDINNGQLYTLINNPLSINLKSTLSYNDCDACFNDNSTFTLESNGTPNPGTNFTITDPNAGSAYFITNQTGTYNFIINVTDAGGLSDTATLTIIVSRLAGVVVAKNIYYLNQTSTNITYRIDNTVYNFLGTNNTNFTLIDEEISLNTSFVLNNKESKEINDNLTINKTLTDNVYLFDRAIAYTSNIPYFSNQPRIAISYLGGPFDISIIASPQEVETSDTIYGNVTIINQNENVGQDVILRYWVSDDTNTTYDSGQKTIFVAANETLNTTISLAAPSFEGEFFLYAKITWGPGNSTAQAFDKFDVVKAPTPAPPSPGGKAGAPSEEEEEVPEEAPEEVPEKVPEEEKEEIEEEKEEKPLLEKPLSLLPQYKTTIFAVTVSLGTISLLAFIIISLWRKPILIIGERNVLRSPFTEKLLKKIAKEKNLHYKYKIKSGGILTQGEHPISKTTKELAKRYNLDLSKFKTKTITKKMVKNAHKIIVMEDKIKDFIIENLPELDKSELEKKIVVLNVESPSQNIYGKAIKTIKDRIKDERLIKWFTKK